MELRLEIFRPTLQRNPDYSLATWRRDETPGTDAIERSTGEYFSKTN